MVPIADVKKVLIFPAGTEIAFEIHKALRYNKMIELYGGVSLPCHADFVFKNCVNDLPFVDSPEFIQRMNELIDRYDIDYIYPAHDSVCLTLARNEDKLHAGVISSSLETVELCRSKKLTYRHLNGAWYLPKVYDSADAVSSYPVFIKPSVGQGSVGAVLVGDRDALYRNLSSGKEYVICEYLPGEEVTVDCFTDRHGTLLFSKARGRDRIRSGIAVRSHFLPYDESVEKIAADINSRFDFNGAWFFQLKKDRDGNYKLLEVAPRIAGTMGITRNLGVNMPLLTIYNTLGFDVGILNNESELILDRAFISRFKTDVEFDSVYLDFDDSLVLRGEVNPSLMAFLYQMQNKGKKLFLLTKHAGDLNEALQHYNIAPGLFREIIHIEKGRNKADFVKGKSIFIDDSYAERKRVRDACGVPVFDLDAVESLIDWRG